MRTYLAGLVRVVMVERNGGELGTGFEINCVSRERN